MSAKLWGPLFKARPNAFGFIGGGKKQLKRLAFKLQALVQGQVHALKHGLFDELQCQGRQGRQLGGQCQGACLDLLVWHHLADQPHCQGGGGVKRLTAQQDFHGGKFAYGAGQALGGAAAGHEADLDLWLPKAGTLTGHDDVGMHGQFAAPAQGMAPNRRNHRFAAAADGPP